MKTVFADTHYWLALANPHDQWHEPACKAQARLDSARIVTTDEVLAEFLTAMCKKPELRSVAVKMVRSVMRNPNIHVRAQSHDTFLSGLGRYESRGDKSYSFTDCASMNAMDAEGFPRF